MEEIQFDESELYNTIRRNIKKYRKQQKMTADTLSQKVGVSHDFIRQIESEKTAYNFSFKTFYKISVALGVKMDDLIQKQKR